MTNPWLVLPLYFVVCLAGAALTYVPRLRDSAVYPPGFAALCLAMAGLWVYATRRLPPSQIMAFSLAWDGVMAAAYYAIPAVMIGASWRVCVGAVLVVAGITLAKSGAP